MTKTMAEVLAEHEHMYYSFNIDTRERRAACSCGDMPLASKSAAHQAAALTAAGYGLVADAKREALEEAAAERQTRADTLLNTMKNMTEMIGTYSHDDITRYGAYSAEAQTTAAWLHARAAEMRQG